MNVLAIFIGGGLGSVMRYGIGLALKSSGIQFPLGTLLANIIACLILGLTVGIYHSKFAGQNHLWLFITMGICGGMSTFSTFGLENAILIRNEQYLYLALNIFISLSAGIGLIWFLLRFHELKA